jgi:ferrous iron transport protein B
LGSDATAEDKTLMEAISSQIPLASAVAFIVVIMTYLPCLAASVVFTREAGGIKYFGYLFLFTTIVAYVLAFVAYHVTLWLS